MVISIADKPIKDREELKEEIKKWDRINHGCLLIALLFILVGVIGEALKIDLPLAPTSWFLLAILFAVVSVAPHIQVVIDRQIYGIESERKK